MNYKWTFKKEVQYWTIWNIFVNIKYIEYKESVYMLPYLYKSTACYYNWFSTIIIQLSIGKIKICKMYIINTCSDYKAPCTADRLCVLDRLLKCTIAFLESLTSELFKGRNLICYSSTFNRVVIQSYFIRAHSKHKFHFLQWKPENSGKWSRLLNSKVGHIISPMNIRHSSCAVKTDPFLALNKWLNKLHVKLFAL